MAEDNKVEEVRKFTGPNEKEYSVVAPSANDIREADWNYSRTYTRSLTEGITTSAEMMDILRRRGIVGPEFEQRAAELTAKLNQDIWALETAETMEDKRDLAVKVAETRDELFQWNQRLSGPMSNTCEQLADDARLEYLTSSMIVDSKGERAWPDFDSYLREKNQALALKARFEIMLYLQGLDSDFLEKTPEARAMKEVEIDVLEKAEEAARALEAVEVEEVKKVAPKKRAPRKKKAVAQKSTKEVPAE